MDVKSNFLYAHLIQIAILSNVWIQSDSFYPHLSLVIKATTTFFSGIVY